MKAQKKQAYTSVTLKKHLSLNNLLQQGGKKSGLFLKMF